MNDDDGLRVSVCVCLRVCTRVCVRVCIKRWMTMRRDDVRVTAATTAMRRGGALRGVEVVGDDDGFPDMID